ncbi:MAG TPA: helix-turn-helix transcriptional regulator, partial [Thermoanaerobaculia bacterium]
MRQEDLSELRAVLREAVTACRRSNRDLEDDLGLGHGSLQRMLDGRVDVRVQHLVALARLLQVHPMEFLELGFPDWPVHHHLTDWMRPDLRKRARKRPGLPSTREELS